MYDPPEDKIFIIKKTESIYTKFNINLKEPKQENFKFKTLLPKSGYPDRYEVFVDTNDEYLNLFISTCLLILPPNYHDRTLTFVDFLNKHFGKNIVNKDIKTSINHAMYMLQEEVLSGTFLNFQYLEDLCGINFYTYLNERFNINDNVVNLAKEYVYLNEYNVLLYVKEGEQFNKDTELSKTVEDFYTTNVEKELNEKKLQIEIKQNFITKQDTQLEKVKGELESKKEQYNKIRDQLKQVEGELKSEREQCDKLKEQLKQVEDKLESENEGYKRLNLKLKNVVSTNKILTTENKEFKENLEKAEKENKDLKLTTINQYSDNVMLSQQNENLTTENKEFKEKLNTATNTNVFLTEENTNLKTELQNNNETIKVMQEKIDDLKNQLQELNKSEEGPESKK